MAFKRIVIAYKRFFLDYRIFAFFDKGNLIVLGNAFKKKTQKTPKKEIEKALLIIKEYTNEKNR
jgi:phage-related protein